MKLINFIHPDARWIILIMLLLGFFGAMIPDNQERPAALSKVGYGKHGMINQHTYFNEQKMKESLRR